MTKNENLSQFDDLVTKTDPENSLVVAQDPKDVNSNGFFGGIWKKYEWYPKQLSLNDINPVYNYKVGVPSIAVALLFDYFYKRRYLIQKAKTLRLFNFTVYYFLTCFLLTNGLNFYEHYERIHKYS